MSGSRTGERRSGRHEGHRRCRRASRGGGRCRRGRSGAVARAVARMQRTKAETRRCTSEGVAALALSLTSTVAVAIMRFCVVITVTVISAVMAIVIMMSFVVVCVAQERLGLGRARRTGNRAF